LVRDIAMPEMDGITALEIIRERFPMEDLPIVMVTGCDDAESRTRALEHRANDFIAKPVEQGELMARLGNILTMRWAKREVEERLVEAQEEQEAMVKMMGSAVHDIKGALTCVNGFLELAISKCGAEGMTLVEGYLGKAVKAVERSAALAEEASDVSAMSRGKLRTKMAEIVLRGQLEKKLADFRGISSMNNVSLKMECDVESPVAWADPAILDRLFGNLISGAIRRAGPGGSVTVSVTQSGGNCMVVVGDSGAGASRPFRQRLYDRECQKEFLEVGLDSSTGIGMSFVRMALEAMGGKMWVSSEPGEGTHFSFILAARAQPVHAR